MYYLNILLVNMKRSMVNLRIFYDPNLLPGGEGDYTHIYRERQVMQCVYCPMSIGSSVAWCLNNGAVLPPHLEKLLQFILYTNKVIHHFHLAVQSQFQYILRI